MAAKKKLDLASVIRDMERSSEKAAEAEALIAARDPMKAIQTLNEALDAWQKSGPNELAKNDLDYIKFVKHISRQTTMEVFVVMRRALELLSAKLQESGEFIQPRELSSIMAELGRQISVFNKLEGERYSPPDESDLDKQISELTKELDLGSRTSGNA